MKNTGFLWLRKSIFAKFTFSFITVGLIPLLVLSFFSLNTFSNYIERYTLNNYEQMLLFSSKNTDDLFIKYNDISKLMYSYGVEGKYGQLGEAITDQASKGEIRVVDDFLKTVLYTDSHLKSTVFVYPDGGYQHLNKANKRIDFRYHYPPQAWLSKAAEYRQDLTVIPTHPTDYYSGSDGPVITFGRNLIDIGSGLDGQVVGTLFMDVGISAFEEIFDQMSLNSRDAIYVTDTNGIILYSNKQEWIGQEYRAERSDDDFVYLTKNVARAGWTVVGEINKEEMFSRIDRIKETIAFVITACMLALIAVAVWFSRNLSNPIRSIKRHMVRVESGMFDTQVEIHSNDEIGMLARGFNKMTARLQSYIDEVYVAQIKQKQAELYALKSQIRPHYLYNTLEVIRMSAVANDDNEVGDMILSLSHQLKYVLDYGEETVTLRQEKNNIEQYVKLMILRYGEHRLAMDLRLDGEALCCCVPKLSLQPLIENAIYHGIMPKPGKGTIRITADIDRVRNALTITVDDDGVGIEPEHVERIRERLQGELPAESGTGGYGMKNVHDRIRTLYGAEFGMAITSSPLIGTSVSIVVPYHKEGDKS